MKPEDEIAPAWGGIGEDEAWSRAVVESSLDAVIVVRLDGTIVRWNPAAEQIYGFGSAEVVGRHVSLIVPPDRQDEFESFMAALPQGRGLRGHETVRVRKDGRRIDVSLTISPVRDATRKIVGGSVVAREITEPKRTREELRQSRERLAIALQAAEIGLFRWEIDSGRVVWDHTLRAMFGLKEGETVSTFSEYLERVHPDDRESVMSGVQQSLDHGADYSREYRIILADGETRWLAAKARPFFDDDGRPIYLTGACRDVTERRQTQEALAAALEQKELLLREINHRVKNSLQLASSLLQVQAASGAPDDVRRALSEASSRLVTVARVHERLYRGDDLQSVGLHDYLAHLCDDIRGSTAGTTAEIVTTVEKLALGADKAILIGLLINELVTNALKHAVPRGERCEVRVDCRRTGSGIFVSVADNGGGLPDGFDVHSSTSFGMRLVNAFARQLGGALDVDSSPRGTRFALEIPVETTGF